MPTVKTSSAASKPPTLKSLTSYQPCSPAWVYPSRTTSMAASSMNCLLKASKHNRAQLRLLIVVKVAWRAASSRSCLRHRFYSAMHGEKKEGDSQQDYRPPSFSE